MCKADGVEQLVTILGAKLGTGSPPVGLRSVPHIHSDVGGASVDAAD